MTLLPISGRSAVYREKRSHNFMIDSHWVGNKLPQNILSAANEGRISIKCCRFTYFDKGLECFM